MDDALLELFGPQSEALKSEINIDNAEEYQDQEQLFLAVNRYTCEPAPRQPASAASGPGLTLVFSHANGFHKEIWEPALSDLLDALDAPGAQKSRPIDEIWALDCAIQGDSAVLNEAVLGNTFSWADHGRDLINFLLSYIDSPSLSSSSSPTSLPPTLTPITSLDSSLFELDSPPHPTGSRSPSLRLWRNKIIVGIGHSLGGAGTAYAASAIPSLFSSIILLDPVLPPLHHAYSVGGLTGGALVRRDRWASREEATEGFLKKAFFRNWDPRVLSAYVQHGLKETKGGVGLKARARDEALVFADPMASSSRRAFSRLHTLPAELPVHFVFADEGRSVLKEEYLRDLLKEIKHASFARVKGAGHLVAQERPRETAEEMAAFLRQTYPAESRAKL
ncbi:hypothetical protein RQP46_006531 [Phenoliferia psychrophenolica]